MRLRVTTYFNILLFFSTCFMIYQNVEIGFIYMLFSLALIAPYYILRVPQNLKYIYITVIVILYLAYGIRPLLLVFRLDMFSYPNVGRITNEILLDSLIDVSIYIFVFLIGFIIGLKLYYNRINSGEIKSPKSDFISYQLLFNTFIVVMLLLKFVLVVVLGAGLKGLESTSRFSFLLRAIPEDVIFFLCFMMILEYKDSISKSKYIFYAIILLGFSLVILITGSKIFLLKIVMVVFIYYLSNFGDFKVKLSNVVVLSSLLSILVVISFSVSFLVKLYLVDPTGEGLFSFVLSNLSLSLDQDRLLELFDGISNRFVGTDGMLAIELYKPDILHEVFSLPETLVRIFGRIIPFYDDNSEYTGGKIIGIIYAGLNDEHIHAGAIGIFGSLLLMFDEYAILGVFGYGLLMGCFFSGIAVIKHDLIVKLLRFVGIVYLVFFLLISGNFDYIISVFISAVVQLFIYVFLFYYGNKFLRMSGIIVNVNKGKSAF